MVKFTHLVFSIVLLLGVGGNSYAQVPSYPPGAPAASSTSLSWFRAGSGSVGAPSFSFIDRATDGIYSPASGTLGIVLNGVFAYYFTGNNFHMQSDERLIWSSSAGDPSFSPDLFLGREGANHSMWQNSTNAQRASWANTYTSTTNYEAFSVDWQTTANVAIVGTRTAATGTSRPLYLVSQASSGATNYNEFRIIQGSAFKFNAINSAAQVAATQTTAPTCTANCGTSPSIVGSDTAMILTMGATGVPASGFVITFNGTWAAAPSCTGAMALAGMVVGKLPLTLVTTTTTLTVVTNGTAPATSDKYAFKCIGVQ